MVINVFISDVFNHVKISYVIRSMTENSKYDNLLKKVIVTYLEFKGE